MSAVVEIKEGAVFPLELHEAEVAARTAEFAALNAKIAEETATRQSEVARISAKLDIEEQRLKLEIARLRAMQMGAMAERELTEDRVIQVDGQMEPMDGHNQMPISFSIQSILLHKNKSKVSLACT
jgi:hypothetical protein